MSDHRHANFLCDLFFFLLPLVLVDDVQVKHAEIAGSTPQVRSSGPQHA